MFFLKLFINKLKNICKIQSGTFVSDTNGTFHSVTSAITKSSYDFNTEVIAAVEVLCSYNYLYYIYVFKKSLFSVLSM